MAMLAGTSRPERPRTFAQVSSSDPLGVICANDAKVGVDASPRSPDSSSLPSEYPLRLSGPAASLLPGSTAIPMTMSGTSSTGASSVDTGASLAEQRGTTGAHGACRAPPFEILVDPDGGKKRSRLSAPNAPRYAMGRRRLLRRRGTAAAAHRSGGWCAAG